MPLSRKIVGPFFSSKKIFRCNAKSIISRMAVYESPVELEVIKFRSSRALVANKVYELILLRISLLICAAGPPAAPDSVMEWLIMIACKKL